MKDISSRSGSNSISSKNPVEFNKWCWINY